MLTRSLRVTQLVVLSVPQAAQHASIRGYRSHWREAVTAGMPRYWNCLHQVSCLPARWIHGYALMVFFVYFCLFVDHGFMVQRCSLSCAHLSIYFISFASIDLVPS